MSFKRLIVLGAFFWGICLLASAPAETLTLPRDQRPGWLRRDGIVMAGSWEPLLFRVRRDGGKDYTPTPEQQAAYRREHSPAMVARLKDLGVNFVMMHCYKGGGLEAERESMADAVQFAKLCHDAGLHVGVYAFSGTLLWELFFKEVPEAENWVLRDPQGKPITYGKAAYRYRWNRNHPDAAAYHQQIVRFAIQEIQADLIHLDNYSTGPGWDANSVERLRKYLAETFTPAERAGHGMADLEKIQPPTTGSPELLQYAWRDFCCASLADSFQAMTRYARSLRPDILMECNPAGVRPRIVPPIDHGRLLQGGEAFWDEGPRPGYAGGKLQTRIRTYKVARCMDNMAFTYVTNPLEAAEAMAFNRDCLGAVCWFEYGEPVSHPGQKTLISPELTPFIRFFHQRRDLLREAEVVADLAVLRSFPSQAFAALQAAQITDQVEEALLAEHACFQIIYDHQLADLRRYRALVLAGCTALGDPQIRQIGNYVRCGGRICIVGPVATHDQWNQPRSQPALGDLPPDRVVRVAAKDDLVAALRDACGGKPSLSAQGPAGLCSELTEQPDRRLLHLVNYQAGHPASDVVVRLRVAENRQVQSVTLASPEHDKDLPVTFRQRGGEISFVVPSIGTYEIAVVKFY